MYNFDPYKVLLAIATNIPVLLMTASVLQGHKYISSFSQYKSSILKCHCKCISEKYIKCRLKVFVSLKEVY